MTEDCAYVTVHGLGIRMEAEAYASQQHFFDAAWYLQQVPEAAGASISPFEHYLRFGVAQGQPPNRLLASGGGVAAAGQDGGSTWAPEPCVEIDVAAIASSGAFDRDYYLKNNPDVAEAGGDPLWHFCRHGWKELRNPAPHFDVWWYWCRYMHPAHEWMNPLVHYVLFGQAEGWSGRPTAFPQDGGHRHAPANPVSRVCLFAGYDVDGVIDDYVVRYVRELSRHADVYYLADCGMGAGELEKLAGFVKGAWARRHGAYDFGSWSLLARELVGWETISGYDELLLVNDSGYLLRDLGAVFAKMDSRRCDWWGLQATKGIAATRGNPANAFQEPVDIDVVKQKLLPEYESDYVYDFLLGSYFLAFRTPVIGDAVFQRLLSGVTKQASKKAIIQKYEIGLMHVLAGMGYEFDSFVDRLYPFHPIYSDNIFRLVSEGFPLFKRYLLIENHYHVPGLSCWKERLLELVPDAPVEEMERNLLRVADQGKLQQSFGVEVGKDGIARPPAMLDAAEFRAADLETPTFDHWWAFPVCAYDNLLTGNERAVFEQVRDDPSIKKIVLTRRRRVDLGGRNVVVCPLDSPQGQYHLLRSGQIFVKHSPSINAKWPLSPTLHNFINLWHGIPLKRFGPASLDMDQKLDWVYRENRSCRAVISSSKVDALAMAAAFYPLPYRDVWITGLPRNDFIVCPQERLPADFQAEGRRLERELAGRKLVLFAPTFKNAQADGYYRFDDAELAWLRGWLEANDAVLGVREHMADSAHAYQAQLSPLGALDLSSRRYPNIEVLYRQSVMLVTDYSSCAIDFMLTGRPAISFAYDLEQYAQSERGLFYDLDHVFPGPVCGNFAELRDALELLGEIGGSPKDMHLRRQTFFQYEDDRSAWRVTSRVKALCLDDEPCVVRC